MGCLSQRGWLREKRTRGFWGLTAAVYILEVGRDENMSAAAFVASGAAATSARAFHSGVYQGSCKGGGCCAKHEVSVNNDGDDQQRENIT